jgi:uncharacterized hydrophobic protein (TIGR00271 family)
MVQGSTAGWAPRPRTRGPTMTASTDPAPPPRLADARLSLGAARLDDLFPEGATYRDSLRTYAVLLTLAAFVASFGLFQDSAASIIGAMVIAPLGGAILAVAAALVTGRLAWQRRTLVQVLLSALWVIVIGYVVAWLIPDLLALTPALEARTEPTILDLGVALAAGAAGAWVAARHTGSDALPGVAIAVSLVPPLATVGICLEAGRLDDAAGALVLFVTNVAAIVVVACVVFLLTGTRPIADGFDEGRRLRSGLVAAVVALSLVAVPLVWRSAENAAAAVAALSGAPVVEAWIGDRDLTVTAYDIQGDVVELVVAGSQLPEDVPALAAELASTWGHPVDLTLTYVPRIRVQADAE